jgi:rRNA maturation endonuclease Nob1
MTIWLGVGAAMVIMGVVGVVFYLRSRKPKEEEYYHFRCTNCKRRLRYRARQVGNAGTCNSCGGAVRFPPISQSID